MALLPALLGVFSPLNARAQTNVLAILASDGNVQISWAGSNLWLQSSFVLGDTDSWINVPNSPIIQSNGISAVNVPATNTVQFFRLVSSMGLPPPTRLIVANSDADLLVLWDPVPGAISYTVYLAAAPSVSPSTYTDLPQGQAVPGITNTWLLLTNLIQGDQYSFVVTASLSGMESAYSPLAQGVFGSNATVQGTFYTEIVTGIGTTTVPLPGVTVFLTNLATGTLSATTVSGLDGQFFLANQPTGNYQLCWQADGFQSGCLDSNVVVSNETVYLDPQQLFETMSPGYAQVSGAVFFLDGSIPYRQDAFYNINVNSRVVLTDANGRILSTVIPDTEGKFVMPSVPLGNGYKIQATCEQDIVTTSFDLLNDTNLTLLLDNIPPTIASLAALAPPYNFTDAVTHASPGTVLQITATAFSAINAELSYQFFTEDGAVTPALLGASNYLWTVPDVSGVYWLYVRVSDGYGGYATAALQVESSPGAFFNGVVIEADPTNSPYGEPIANATVMINGVQTQTDSNGEFSLLVSNSQPPYVLSASQTGYVPVTETFEDGESEIVVEMPALQIGCSVPYSLGDSLSFSQSPSLPQLQINQIQLVYTNGVPFTGTNFCIQLTGIDPCGNPEAFPDGRQTNSNGSNFVLEAVSAVNFQLTDTNGLALQLTNGASAIFIMPVSTACQQALTNYSGLISNWWFNPATGAWEPDGGTLQVIAGGSFVQMQVPTPRTGLRAAAAPVVPRPLFVRLKLVDSLAGPFTGVVLNALEKFRAPFTRTKRILIDPSVTNLQVGMLDMREMPLPSEAYYTNPSDINSRVNPATIPLTSYQSVPLFKAPINFAGVEFGLFLSTNSPDGLNDALNTNVLKQLFQYPPAAAGENAIANKYYALLDDDNADNLPRTTFAQWKTANGFNSGDTTGAYFFNAADLGFGRSMHMKTNGTNLAFYVANYKDSAAAKLNQGPGITVCMEYTPGKKEARQFIKFYVFNGKGVRVNSANLDDQGEKFIPNLCMVCHGGVFNKVSGVSALTTPDVSAYYLPFDLESYSYAPTEADSPVAQGDQFKQMNLAVLNSKSTPATQALINAWYANGQFNYQPVISDWGDTSTNNLYHVVKTSCRTCHISRVGRLSFDTMANFQKTFRKSNGDVNTRTEEVVCSLLAMPNALRSQDIFWGTSTGAKLATNGFMAYPPGRMVSTSLPDVLKNFFGWGDCPVGGKF